MSPPHWQIFLFYLHQKRLRLTFFLVKHLQQVEHSGGLVVALKADLFLPNLRGDGHRHWQPLARPHGVQSSGQCHVFLPLCQGQSVPRQTSMENKPEELLLCLKTRGSFEGVLAHKPWPHLAVSCYGELDAEGGRGQR